MEYIIAGRNSYVKIDDNTPYCSSLIKLNEGNIIASQEDSELRRKELITEFYFSEEDFNVLKEELFPAEQLEFKGSLDDFRKDPISSLNKIEFYLDDNVTFAFSINKMIPV